MTTYENSYFRFRLDFPDTWRVTSWRHTNIPRSWQLMYQATDDELPMKGKYQSKFLFTAALHRADSEAFVDADIELSVFRRSPGKDLRRTLIKNFERQRAMYESNGIATSVNSEGIWTIGSMDFTYMDQDSKSRTVNSQYRFFFRLLSESLWLYGKIGGHKPQAYLAAPEIVEGLQSTAEAGGTGVLPEGTQAARRGGPPLAGR